MKIYTKTGDKGTTSLFGGKQVEKNHPLIESYGTVDELNALLGLIRCEDNPDNWIKSLSRIQNELFELGADLATPWDDPHAPKVDRITPSYTERLEKEIDNFEADLEPLKTFILPGGSRLSARLHLARTVCRRAERSLMPYFQEDRCNPDALVYLNRLGDWLFVAARIANAKKGIEDVPWKK